MRSKRVFKTKTFDRWARKLLSDDLLCAAALDIEQGRYEADLDGGVCKKRIAVPGQGKSGSTRTLVAKQHPDAIIFLLGREKNAPAADFPDALVDAVKVIARSLHAQSVEKLDEMKISGELKEICNAKKGQ